MENQALRILGAVAVLVGLMLVVAAPGVAAPYVAYQCSPAPADCSGWYRSDVSLEWYVRPWKAVAGGCVDITFTSDTAGTVKSCTVGKGKTFVTVQVTIRRDATGPEVLSAVPERPPDHAGWFTAPVNFAFTATDATSGLAACAPVLYAGPDGASSVVGTCRDNAGNVSSRAFPLNFDATPLTVWLLSPRANALVRAHRPPLLRWTSVRHARYYNVQVFRGGRKILSAWPERPRYQLKRRWRFAGKHRRLTPGRYVWYVWPGHGRRSRGEYDKRLGRGAFRVVP